MTRRELLFGSIAAASAGCAAQQKPAAGKRPNILFAISDDQSYMHTSAYGDPVVKTPAFDRIAREGILFTQSYTACPSCTPSRSAVLTGRQIWEIGEAGVLYGTLHPEHPLFTHRLADAGYHVGFVGKPWAPGDWRAGGLSRHPIGKEYAECAEPDPPHGIDIRDYAANFADFLAERPDGAPFFFWFGCTEPHRDYEVGIGRRSGLSMADVPVPPYLPDAPEVRSEILDYYYEIEHFDKHLGRMLAKLEEIGELDNTLIIATSDNGMPFSRTKTTLYDSGVRMPTAMRWGNRAPAGRVIDDFIGHIDFAPTFLEAAGIEPIAEHSGKSLLPLLETDRSGRVDAARDRIVTGLERHTYCRENGATYPIRALRTHDFLYIRNFEPDRWPTGGPEFISSNKAPHGDIDDGPFKDFMLREGSRLDFPREFQMGFGKRPAEELYDCNADPHQTANLAGNPEYAEVKQRMAAQLESYLRETNDPRIRGEDPWQAYPYRQTDGFGATYNVTLSEEERAAARSRGKHAVGHAKPEK